MAVEPAYIPAPAKNLGCETDARRYVRLVLAYNGLIYLHFAGTLAGLLPYWTLLLTTPILVVRWMLSVHELFHLRDEREVDPVTRQLPLMITPLILGYPEYRDIHMRHHRYMATPQDPDYFHIRGNKLTGFLNALTAPEQAWFRWVAQNGMQGTLLRDTGLRLVLFAGLVAASGWAFLWYWLPLRLAYGMSYFSFFYCLHRRGADYGVYPLRPPQPLAAAFRLLFGREALLATCYHHVHHANPRIKALHLADAVQTASAGG